MWKDKKDDDLSQEPEMIKAFRDTWELGIHSYLSYLRDRLLLARNYSQKAAVSLSRLVMKIYIMYEKYVTNYLVPKTLLQ